MKAELIELYNRKKQVEMEKVFYVQSGAAKEHVREFLSGINTEKLNIEITFKLSNKK